MIYSTLSATPIRSHFKRWAVPFSLVLMCCALVAHQRTLSTLTKRIEEQVDQAQFRKIEERLQVLEQSTFMVVRSDDSALRETVSNLQNVVNERLESIEEALATLPPEQDLSPLLQRIDLLEAGYHRLTQFPPPPKTTLPSRKPKKPADPGFQILGLELRGGHVFLAVGPLGVQSLDQSHLLKIGDSYLGWKLEGFEEQSAVFAAEGVTHRLSIP